MAAASLSLTPKSLPLSLTCPKSLPFISLSLPIKPFSVVASSKLGLRFRRFVSMSSEIGEDEEEEYEEDEVQMRQERRRSSPESKIYVGNLPYNVDNAQLAGLFESAGTVETVEVIYDKITGRSKGFAFVTMASIEDVEAAAQQFNGYELQGRSLRVNAGPPPPKTEGSFNRTPIRGGFSSGSENRVHVSNLSWDVDESALRELFSEQGDVVDAKVIYDRETGKSRGFGFVTFNSAEEVNNAIEGLDGAELLGRSIRVNLAEARPRREF